jgi:formamidopyrimidine-DNA glycosylase
MPELPEVTTIVNDINSKLVGRTIIEARLTSIGENLRVKSKQNLEAKLAGKKIEKAERKAKYLLLKLSNGANLAIHLKLTGQFILRDKTTKADEFTRMLLNLDNGKQIRFNDRNGAAEAFVTDSLELIEASTGKDAFEITAKEFSRNLQNSDKKTIKESIVDQRIVAGVGNIYADEALFVAKINPFAGPKSLTEEGIKALLEAIKQVLNEGIEHRGTTIDSYRDLFGNPGAHQNFLRVYGKSGKPCANCGEPIEYAEINGRRTHFCPKCQPSDQLSLF